MPRRVLTPQLAAQALIAWTLVSLAGSPEALGQTFRTRDQGINVGRFLLYPSITFDFSRNSNVFYRSADLPKDEIISSGILLVRPRILVDLPLGENRIRWIYSPTYRDYTTNRLTQADHFSHFFDLEASFQFGPSIEVVLRDHLVRGTVELQEVDPGGELVFGLVPFTTDDPSLEINLALGPRHGVSVIPRYSTVTFARAGNAAFFNFFTRGLEARYNYLLSEATTMYGYYGYDDTDQSRQQVLFSDVTVLSRKVGVGLRRTINDVVVTTFRAAYETLDFAGASDKNYAGPIIEGNLELQLSDVTALNLTLIRQGYQSFFVNNNYYLSNEVGLQITQQIGRSTYWQAGTTFELLDYANRLDIRVTPSTPPGEDANMNGLVDAYEGLAGSVGVRRRDHAIHVSLGAGYQLRQALRLFIGYNWNDRGSNIREEIAPNERIDPYNYKVSSLTFRLEAGWL